MNLADPRKREEYAVELRRLFATVLLKDGLITDESQAQVELVRCIKEQAEAIYAMVALPSVVLQENQVVASYPATLWQHIKCVLGFNHRRREVRVSEFAMFPEFRPPAILGQARLGFDTWITEDDAHGSTDHKGEDSS